MSALPRLLRLSARSLPLMALLATSTATVGCKSVQDGARQVSLGAQDLGRKMTEPFKKGSSGLSSRDNDRGESDPFLPPPRRPDDETSSLVPRPLSVATLGEPILSDRILDDRISRVSKPLAP
jgi:hypothetical protein